MSAAELRKAAETLQAAGDLPTRLNTADVAYLMEDVFRRAADVLTTVKVLDEAGVETLVLDGANEVIALARLINGGAA